MLCVLRIETESIEYIVTTWMDGYGGTAHDESTSHAAKRLIKSISSVRIIFDHLSNGVFV